MQNKLAHFTQIIFFGFVISFNSTAQDKYKISDFKNEGLNNWKEIIFHGQTEYTPKLIDGVHAIQANSNKSASGFVKNQNVDLTIYPFLNWCWRTDTRLGQFDEKTKHGDDYSLRIYVINKGFFWGLNSKWINYVWSSNNKKNDNWPNAFLRSSKMLVLRDSSDSLSKWYCEKRNIPEDFKNQHGNSINQVDVVAFMTDTDNTKKSAISYYGNIFFSKK
jgi:hypothetical protein